MNLLYPKRAKLNRFRTVFYLHNGKLIEKYNWAYYFLLLPALPFIIALQLLLLIYRAVSDGISELASEDFGRTIRTDNISESHIKILLKGEEK